MFGFLSVGREERLVVLFFSGEANLLARFDGEKDLRSFAELDIIVIII